MSGSPKYSWVRLRTAREQALRDARRAAEARERANRAAVEQQRRAVRLDQTRKDVARELDALRRQGSGIAAGLARRVAPDLQALDRKLAALKATLDSATRLEDVRRTATQLRRVRDEMRQAIARANAAAFAEGKAEGATVLAELRARVAALDRDAADQHDPGVLAALNTLLDDAEDALARQAPAKARHRLEEAATRLERHLAAVQGHVERRDEARDRGLAALADLGDRVAALRADPVVMRWASREVDALAGRLAQARSRIEAGDLAGADREAAALEARIEALVLEAQEAQLLEDRRAYIVAGIVQVMGEMGFVVQAGSPAPEDPAHPGSASIIHARRIGGGAVAVSVPQRGEIWYDVDGFPKRLEPSADGRLAPSCDEAEAQIEQMHAALDDRFGIETGELLWEGKATRPDRKQAEQLPDDRAQPRRAGGPS